MIKHLIPPGTLVAPTGRPELNMLPDFIKPWDFSEELDAGIVGVPFNFHQTFQATSQGPGAIRETFLKFATRSFDFEVDISDLKVRDIGDIQRGPPLSRQHRGGAQRAVSAVTQLHTNNRRG